MHCAFVYRFFQPILRQLAVVNHLLSMDIYEYVTYPRLITRQERWLQLRFEDFWTDAGQGVNRLEGRNIPRIWPQIHECIQCSFWRRQTAM
jgi:hypothetical protein